MTAKSLAVDQCNGWDVGDGSAPMSTPNRDNSREQTQVIINLATFVYRK